MDFLNFRMALAQQLARDGCYNRVQLAWVEADVVGLCKALSSPATCPEQLTLYDICQLSEHAVDLLFGALGSSIVRNLNIVIERDPKGKGIPVCEMIRVNRHLRSLHLSVQRYAEPVVNRVLSALAVNTGIEQITIEIFSLTMPETFTALEYFFSRNKAATEVSLHCDRGLAYQHLIQLTDAISKNSLIVDLELPCYVFGDRSSFPLFESVRQNKMALNRAIEFVQLHIAERAYAIAFEQFFDKHCLLAHYMKITGKAQALAIFDIASARHFLQENFLVITGVTQRGVIKCHPASVTQADSLNADCWCVIVSYLKITDVLTSSCSSTKNNLKH
ncbi:hypothetical protein HPB49_012884 [Dermacentor silvarum]|uniref:Uncharacterized protein n=1 Tax=Dermacentor silvarum TaxID=543639 RepID=A0ACB8CXD8_DERSI|nr:hypothetical protein HPB49_012884 [Dermacentor silvarum]